HEIEQSHGIRVETFSIASATPEGFIFTDEGAQARIYRNHFVSRASVLKARLGETVPRLLRSRRGLFYVVDRIAILEDGQVGWVTSWDNCAQIFSIPDPSSWRYAPERAFLEALRDQGTA